MSELVQRASWRYLWEYRRHHYDGEGASVSQEGGPSSTEGAMALHSPPQSPPREGEVVFECPPMGCTYILIAIVHTAHTLLPSTHTKTVDWMINQ
jgi:hypothetical protein